MTSHQDPSWDLYRSLLAVLRTGSLSAAARSLRLTQPTVGRHIEILESDLGGRPLFTRSQRGLLPTATALRLRSHAETMAAAAAALTRTAEGSEETAAMVRLAAPEVIGVEVLPEILSDFRLTEPGTAVELTLSNDVVDLLRRDADIAVRAARPKQKALLARRAGKVQLQLHAHRRYLARHGEPRMIADLYSHTLIGWDRTPPAARLLKAVPLTVTREAFSFRCDNDIAQLAAIRAGIGIGLCHSAIARRDPELVPVLGDAVALEVELWVVMHEDLKRSPKVRALFDQLVTHVSRFAASGPV